MGEPYPWVLRVPRLQLLSDQVLLLSRDVAYRVSHRSSHVFALIVLETAEEAQGHLRVLPKVVALVPDPKPFGHGSPDVWFSAAEPFLDDRQRRLIPSA